MDAAVRLQLSMLLYAPICAGLRCIGEDLWENRICAVGRVCESGASEVRDPSGSGQVGVDGSIWTRYARVGVVVWSWWMVTR